MTTSPKTPEQEAPHVADGTDVTADPQHLDDAPHPASSDPAEMTEDSDLGGVGGQDAGGAG